MSARAEREIPIRYLSVDEMMLKIAEMRAARVVPKMPLPLTQPAPRESVEPLPKLEFPDYISHCEAWSGGATPGEAADLAEIPPAELPLSRLVPSRASASAVYPIAARDLARSLPTKLVLRRYVFGALTAGVAALLLAAGVFKLQTGVPAMPMTASADRSLVAGGDPWNELPTEEIISQAAVPEAVPRHLRHRLTADQLEGNIRATLARNGFPDIGVSASHHGEVYLAGAVFSTQEAADIVRVARHASRGGRVYFLHPEVHDVQGPTFFGAMAQYDPAVWGARVRSVVIGSPAEKAGIRAGDVIREFDHATIADARELEKAVEVHSPGERVAVRSWRDGENKYSIARLTGLTQFASR
jgi:PDZ domain/BON domain